MMGDANQNTPSPLAGEGREGGESAVSQTGRADTPTPNPAPQGGGEQASYAKRRLPFDEAAPARHPGVTAAAVLYGAAMLIAFGVAVFMATAQRQPVLSVPVLASIAIGIWFFIRMLMTLRTPRAPRE